MNCNLNVSGNSNFNGNVSITNTLTVTNGDVNVSNGALSVNGASNLYGTVSLGTDCSSQINILGNTNVNCNLYVNDNLTVNGITTLQDTTVDGNLTVCSPVDQVTSNHFTCLQDFDSNINVSAYYFCDSNSNAAPFRIAMTYAGSNFNEYGLVIQRFNSNSNAWVTLSAWI
jgi:hypothetical protein